MALKSPFPPETVVYELWDFGPMTLDFKSKDPEEIRQHQERNPHLSLYEVTETRKEVDCNDLPKE